MIQRSDRFDSLISRLVPLELFPMRFHICLLLLLSPSISTAATPNVILIYADDLGYGDLGCYGNTKIKTPHLDQLASQGVRFTDFYVAQAVCSASRAALLTGCYPNRIGILGALGPTSKNGINADEVTLGELFQSKGYRTAIYGKWHLGHHLQFLPTRNGFHDYYGLPYSNDMWPKHPTAKFPPLPLIDLEKAIEFNPDQSRLTTDYTRRAVQFIEKNQKSPFFIYLPHSMPHVPIFVSQEMSGKSRAGLYGDVIEELDSSVGKILSKLSELGLEKNTLVIFASDNGPWLQYGNHAGTTGGLRESKGTSFEGGVRVPCIAKFPGVIPAGLVCKEPAMTIDWFPTFANMIGADLPKHTIDGLDLTDLLTKSDGKSRHEALYFYWGQELQAVRMGDWKLHLPHTYPSMNQGEAGADGKPGKAKPSKIELALFNLREDRSESMNLAKEHPEVVEKISKLAEAMRQELGDSASKTTGKGIRLSGMLKE
jgi:arylsulfatase A